MILLNELRLTNFLSHSETTISFKAVDKFCIEGRSGSGKSSVVESILWCLYGRGRSDNRSLVRRGAKVATVSLKLNDGQRETLITRSVSSNGKNTLVITQNTGSRGQFLPIERVGIKDLQSWLEGELLKASYELFTNSIVYTQNSENSFVKATASRRKDLLLEIVRAGNFDELYEKTRRAITINETEDAVSLSKIEGLETLIKNSEEPAQKHDLYQKLVEEKAGQIETMEGTSKDLEEQLNNFSKISSQIAEKKATMEMTGGHVSLINSQIEAIQTAFDEHQKVDIDGARKNLVEAENLSTEAENIEKELRDIGLAQSKVNAHLANKPAVNDYSRELEIINQRLIPLIKDTGKCPAGDACPFILPIKGQIEFLTQQITEKTERSFREKKDRELWEKEYAAMVPIKDTSELYSKLKDIRNRINTLLVSREVVTKYELFEVGRTDSQSLLSQRITDKEECLKRILSLNRDIEQLELMKAGFDVNKVNENLSNIKILLADARKDKENAAIGLSAALSAQLAIKEAQEALKTLNTGRLQSKSDLESLELLKEALSPRGIKAVVVDYIIPTLEERINGILSQMSDFRIRLDTQKPLVDEGGLKEGLFITVFNDMRGELPFDVYSGGEKVKITIAISEALASLMAHVGFRIMDENIVSLDKESTESFVEILTRLQEKFPQLLVISHLQEVKDIFQKKITISKVNGISKII